MWFIYIPVDDVIELETVPFNDWITLCKFDMTFVELCDDGKWPTINNFAFIPDNEPV